MNSENKIIIFDLWQTLVDSTLRPSDLFDSLFLTNQKITKDIFLKKIIKSDLYLKSVPPEDAMKNFLIEFGVNDKSKLDVAINLWKKMSESSFLVDGSESLLVRLKNNGFKICLLTNIDQYGYENFRFKNLLNLFDHTFLSYKIGLIKPDLKCWEMIKDQLGSDYKNMVMIGDSIENDILPAKNLGLTTFLIDIKNQDTVYDKLYDKLINKT